MLARMCVLEKIPQAFDSYSPPTGINVSWHWNFNGKANENQVVAFFTGTEISLNENEICKEGDIKKEVENNRCFTLIRTIPQEDWSNVVAGFDHGGEVVSMPKEHPNVKPEWAAVEEYEADIDEEILNKINERSEKEGHGRLDTDPSKVIEIKNPKDQGAHRRVKIPFVRFIDVIRAEKD